MPNSLHQKLHLQELVFVATVFENLNVFCQYLLAFVKVYLCISINVETSHYFDRSNQRWVTLVKCVLTECLCDSVTNFHNICNLDVVNDPANAI